MDRQREGGRQREIEVIIHLFTSQKVRAGPCLKLGATNSIQMSHMGGRSRYWSHHFFTSGSTLAGSWSPELASTAQPGIENRYSDVGAGV